MRYIIVGSGIAGISAAKAIREHDQDGEVIVYSSEFHPVGLSARKDLAHWLAKGISSPKEILLESPAALEAQGIHLLQKDVFRVFTGLRQVLLKHTIRKTYDKLLLAVGATPLLVEAPGADLLGVSVLRNYDDLSLIEDWMPELQTRGVVVIGGGLLGLDLAYALRQRGVNVTLIVREGHVGAPHLTAEAATVIQERLLTDGIHLELNQTVAAFLSEDGRVLDAVQLADGRTMLTPMAICAVGVRPTTDFIEDTAINVDEATGAVLVNEYFQTSVPEVYAAGNCALANGIIAYNWALSAEQGRIAGLNMAGVATPYTPVVTGDLHTRIYDLPLAYFGQPSPTAQVWTWRDGSQFAQVWLENGSVTAARLLGEATGMAGQLSQQRDISAEDLEHLILNRSTLSA